MKEAPPTHRQIRRLGLMAGVIGGVVFIDQLTKTWAENHVTTHADHIIWTFQLLVTYNSGIAFSQATGSTPIVMTVATVVLAVLLVVAYRTKGTFNAIVFALIIGGASGNLVDRFVRHHHGSVIDFIDPRWWPVFNVADAAVSIGLVLAVVGSLLGIGSHEHRVGPDRKAAADSRSESDMSGAVDSAGAAGEPPG